MLGYRKFVAKDDFYFVLDDGKFVFLKGCTYVGKLQNFNCCIYDENDNALEFKYYHSCFPDFLKDYDAFFDDVGPGVAKNRKDFKKIRDAVNEKNRNKRLGEQLNRAIQLATEVHANQFDKAGEPYILHPLYVMNQVKTLEEKIVAVLHDVVEDGEMSIKSLKEIYKFDTKIVRAVDAITRRENESYNNYVKRACKNKIAREVKMADLRHNLTASRLKTVTDKDKKRLEKYSKAYQYILNNYFADKAYLRY